MLSHSFFQIPCQCRLQRLCHALGLPLATRVMVYVIVQFSVPCSASLDIGNAGGSLRLSLGLC